jgi:hypothetical protein
MADGDTERRRPAGDLVSLADAVTTLRRQLSEVTSLPTEAGTRLSISEIGMEFSVEAITGADGHVEFWVADAGAGAGSGHAASHRVTIKLTRTGDDGRPVRVSRAWDEGDRPG